MLDRLKLFEKFKKGIVYFDDFRCIVDDNNIVRGINNVELVVFIARFGII
jgi:hypothetical protein